MKNMLVVSALALALGIGSHAEATVYRGFEPLMKTLVTFNCGPKQEPSFRPFYHCKWSSNETFKFLGENKAGILVSFKTKIWEGDVDAENKEILKRGYAYDGDVAVFCSKTVPLIFTKEEHGWNMYDIHPDNLDWVRGHTGEINVYLAGCHNASGDLLTNEDIQKASIQQEYETAKPFDNPTNIQRLDEMFDFLKGKNNQVDQKKGHAI